MKFLRHKESGNKRNVRILTGRSEKQKRISNKESNILSQRTRKRRMNKAHGQQKERKGKNQEELNEIENQKTIENNAIAGSLRRSVKLTKP